MTSNHSENNRFESNGADRQRAERLAMLATTRGLDQLTAEEDAELTAALAQPTAEALRGTPEQASRVAAAVAAAIEAEPLPAPSASLYGIIEAELKAAAAQPASVPKSAVLSTAVLSTAVHKAAESPHSTRAGKYRIAAIGLTAAGLLACLILPFRDGVRDLLPSPQKTVMRSPEEFASEDAASDPLHTGELQTGEGSVSATASAATPAITSYSVAPSSSNRPSDGEGKDPRSGLALPSPQFTTTGPVPTDSPDAPRRDTPRPDAPRPDAPRPDVSRPDVSRPSVAAMGAGYGNSPTVPDGRSGYPATPAQGASKGTGEMMPGMQGGMSGMGGPVSKELKPTATRRGRMTLEEVEVLRGGRQAVPDAYYLADDVQYFERAPEGYRFIPAEARNPAAPVADKRMESLSKGEAARSLSLTSGDTSGEAYAAIHENAFRLVRDEPLSTFSIDVDTASYANVRRFLTQGQRPPKNAVRIEELLNYFSYDYPQPNEKDPFSVNMEVTDCPWRPENRLLRVALRGREVPRAQRPASNLVFLIDVSGSMQPENKLPLVKTALKMLVQELTENDRVSIVTYAGDAGLKLPSTNGTEQRRILETIDSLSSGGSTHGSAGITLAYEQATGYFIRGGTNRVILLTDGDLNVGITDDDALVRLIQEKAKSGVFLTVLGVGEGNLKDSKMEKLADHGNGVYAYLDGVREARKVLVEQMSGSLVTIAKDVKLQIEFNPAQVQAYRLVGYENRVLANRDFHDDTKDAGEIGAGHTVTALYELVPANTRVAGLPEPLKYQPQPVEDTPATPVGQPSRELLTLKLRFKQPEADRSELRDYPLTDSGAKFGQSSTDFRFATSVAMFGLVLRESQYRGSATLAAVEEIATSSLGKDNGGYRSEFVDLVRKAEQLLGR